jgi:hypothetical protein
LKKTEQNKIEPKEFYKDYELRIKADLEFRRLTRKLRNVQKWMPRLAMENPTTKPAKVIKDLRAQRDKAWANLAELKKKKIGEFSRIPLPEPPGRGTALSELEKLREDLYLLGALRQMRETYTFDHRVIISEAEKEANKPKPFSGVVKGEPGFRDLGTVPVAVGIDFDEFDEHFTYDYSFDPNEFTDRGVAGYLTTINNIEWGWLGGAAAVRFRFPKAPYDARVTWMYNATLAMPYTLDAEYASFKINWIEHLRSDISRTQISRFDFNSYAADLSVSVEDDRIDSYKIVNRVPCGVFTVEKDKESDLWVGIEYELEVEEGYGGTFSGWGSLNFWRPMAMPDWGVYYRFEPL